MPNSRASGADAASQDAPEAQKVAGPRELDVNLPQFQVTGARTVDLGELEVAVPNGWIRGDDDAGPLVATFDTPKNREVHTNGRLVVIRHAEPWETTFADLMDAGWTPQDGASSAHAVLQMQAPAVVDEIVRLIRNGPFVVGLHCQYFDEGTHQQCAKQVDRLDLEGPGTEAEGFQFLPEPGWREVTVTGWRAYQLGDGARLLLSSVRKALPRNHPDGITKEPYEKILGERRITYRGRPCMERAVESATRWVLSTHMRTLPLPGGYHALVSCSGPGVPDFDDLCEQLIASAREVEQTPRLLNERNSQEGQKDGR